MRRSTGMIIGLALAAAGAAQAQPVPQNHVPRYAPPGEAPQPYTPPGQAPQGQAPQGQAPQDFRPAPQAAPQFAPQQPPGPQAFAPPPPQGGPAPNYESWGDDQNGGYRYSWGDPNGRDYYEEEYRRQAMGPAQAPAYAQAYAPPTPCSCGGYGGYEIPTYGYASQNYGWPGQGCCAAGGGEVSYTSSSSSWSSGVGGYLADGVWPGGYWPGGYWPGGSWNGGYMPDGRFVGARRWDYDSGWRNLPGRPVVAPR